jgi:hypothetical protein
MPMGWFLTKSSKRKSKGKGKQRSAAGSFFSHWEPHHTVLTLKLSAAAIALAGVGFGWVYGKAALTDYVSRTHQRVVKASDVALVDVPTVWQTKGTLDRVRTLVADRIQPDPLDQPSLTAAVRALEGDPIVHRAPQVRRGSEGRVVVRASYRTPIALLEARDGYHLVDAAGTRLSPHPYYREQLSHDRLDQFPVIGWVDGTSPRRPGARWEAEHVQASLALIRLLGEELKGGLFAQIQAVDASQRDSRGRLRLKLITHRGEILWGFPPGKERAIEPSAEVKVQRLRRLASSYGGRIDADGRYVEIDGPRLQMRDQPLRNAHAP